jgi:hypothetical protein
MRSENLHAPGFDIDGHELPGSMLDRTLQHPVFSLSKIL